MMNESTTPPSDSNISSTTQANLDVTPASDAETSIRSNSRDIHENTQSRRRICIQSTAAHDENFRLFDPSSSATIGSNEEKDEFQELVDHLDEMEMEDADGNESDVEGEEAEGFDEAYVKAMIDRNTEEDGMHVEEISSGEIAFVLAEKGVINDSIDDDVILDKVHKAPDNWVVPAKKVRDEPDFKDVDNPGNWSEFIFRPVYKKIGKGKDATYKYVKHTLPTGCVPVPVDKNGKRSTSGWNFFYQGWKSKKISIRETMPHQIIYFLMREKVLLILNF